jgi:hypothetical protein
MAALARPSLLASPVRFDSVNHQVGFTLRPKALDSNVIPEIGVGYGDRWNLSLGMQF